MVPVKYNIRSIRSRWVSSAMTVLGTALVVWASVLAFGLASGLDHVLTVSSNPLDLIVLRKGSTAETASGIEDEKVRKVTTLPGIASDEVGQPLFSGELVIVVNVPRRGKNGNANLVLRGVTPTANRLRPDFRIVAGRAPREGLNEAMTSRTIAERFHGAGLGENLKALEHTYAIVGLFEAGGSASESEVWLDRTVLAQGSQRIGFVSSIQLRAASAKDLRRLQSQLEKDQQFALRAVTEAQYFKDQEDSGLVIKIVGRFIAVLLTFGATFAVANTMYGAVATRAREIGTLRALGFGRGSVLASFLLESLILCFLGGMLGCLGTLPINGLSTGTANWVTFSELTFSFRFGPMVMLQGAALAMTTGLVGGLFPAVRATRMKITDALREV